MLLTMDEENSALTRQLNKKWLMSVRSWMLMLFVSATS